MRRGWIFKQVFFIHGQRQNALARWRRRIARLICILHWRGFLRCCAIDNFQRGADGPRQIRTESLHAGFQSHGLKRLLQALNLAHIARRSRDMRLLCQHIVPSTQLACARQGDQFFSVLFRGKWRGNF